MRIKTILDNISAIISNKSFFPISIVIIIIMILFFFYYNFLSYSIYSFFILIGFLIFKTILLKDQPVDKKASLNSYICKICIIIFFTSLSLNIVHLQFVEGLYNKSFFYYFTLSLSILSLYTMTLFRINKKNRYLLPAFSFIIALYIYLSNLLIFPNGLFASGDTHYQVYSITKPIVESGHIPLGFKYTNYALHQIFIAINSIIVRFDVFFTYRMIAGILYACGGLFVFSIGKKIKNINFGMISFIIYIIAPHVIYQSTHPYQFSYGLIFGIIILYIFIHLISYWAFTDNNNKIKIDINKWLILFMIFFCCLTITHFYTGLLLLISMAIIFLGMSLSIKIEKNKVNHFRSQFFTLFLFSIVTFISYITYISSDSKTLIQNLNVYSYTLFSSSNYQTGIVQNIETNFINPLSNLLFNHVGIGLIMMFSTIGLLYGIIKKNPYIFTCGIFWIFLFGLKSFGDLTNLIILVGDRVYTFLWITGLIFLSTYGIYKLNRLLPGKKKIISLGLILVLSFLLLGNQYGGEENNYLKESTPYIKVFYTDSDLITSQWLQKNTCDNKSIYVSEEWRYNMIDEKTNRSYYQLPINQNNDIIFDSLFNGSIFIKQKSDYLIGFRVDKLVGENYIEDRRIKLNKVDFKDAEILYSNIYDNENIEMYYSR